MEKANLPIKTKIAAWLMVVIGGSGILLLLFGLISLALIKFMGFPPSLTPVRVVMFAAAPLVIIIALIYFLPGFLLLKRKRGAWWLAISLLSINFISNLIGFFLGREFPIWSFIPLILLILLFLDRKNFWKIAS